MVSSSSFLLTVSVIVFTVFWLIKKWMTKRDLPPGPGGLAAIKFLVDCLKNGFDLETSRLMTELKTDVISIDLFGLKTFIVFGSSEKLAEAFQKKGDQLLKRPINPLKPETIGLLSGYGPQWKEQRRFALTTLRNLGMGKSIVEHSILDEVQSLLNEFREMNDKPFNPQNFLGTAVVNVIASVMFSSKFEHGDPDLYSMIEHFNNLTTGKHVKALVTLTMFDSFYKLPGIQKKVVEHRQKNSLTKKILEKRIRAAEKDENHEEDFVKLYLAELDKRKEEAHSSFNMRQLTEVVEDLFGAGTETTSTTLRWGLLLMATYPDVQTKVYEELYEQIGTKRLPHYSDRERTPYTEAVILEVQRHGNLVPIVRRQAQGAIELFGYTFEPNTTVIANLWHMSRDGKIWDKPDEFHVGHFFDEHGAVKNRDKFYPFCFGKRQCLGESLARMELYLFFTSLLLNFTFSAPEGATLPSASDANCGMVRGPPAFEIRAIRRKNSEYVQ